jgi:hypothetical protein
MVSFWSFFLCTIFSYDKGGLVIVGRMKTFFLKFSKSVEPNCFHLFLFSSFYFNFTLGFLGHFCLSNSHLCLLLLSVFSPWTLLSHIAQFGRKPWIWVPTMLETCFRPRASPQKIFWATQLLRHFSWFEPGLEPMTMTVYVVHPAAGLSSPLACWETWVLFKHSIRLQPSVMSPC